MSVINGVTSETPPLHSPGCCTTQTHLFSANAMVASSLEFQGFLAETVSLLETSGVISTTYDVNNLSLSFATSKDIVVFIHTKESQEHLVQLIEELRSTLPLLPILIFSEPEVVDEWNLQAHTTKDITPSKLVEATKGAIRSKYTPKNPWQPQIFLSYTRADASRVGTFSFSFLRYMHCWIDTNILTSGVEWSTEIIRGIESSDLFVLFLSPATPEHSYCWIELRIAIKAKKPIFVISYGDSLKKLLSLNNMRHIAWHRRIFKSDLSGEQSILVDDPVAPNFILFDSIPNAEEFSGGNIRSRVWDITDFLKEWPKSFMGH